MKNLIIISFSLLVFVSCNSGPEQKTQEVIKKEEVKISFEELSNLISNGQPISGDFLSISSKPKIEGTLQEHTIIKDSESYIIIRSSDDGTSIRKYFLLSFSKTTGELLDYINVGTEAEGVDPFKLIWNSEQSFSTIEYQYDFIEDEESGAYMKGELLDSVVVEYLISQDGMLTTN